jgi:hypothetical protein
MKSLNYNELIQHIELRVQSHNEVIVENIKMYGFATWDFFGINNPIDIATILEMDSHYFLDVDLSEIQGILNDFFGTDSFEQHSEYYG